MIIFIGAGPGDPELITVKGLKILKKADVVIYAGSLVNKDLLKYLKKESIVFNSASMTLNEIIEIMEKYSLQKKLVVRLHSGDPSIFGAIREQMNLLDKKNIKYEVIPGVSSFCAAAAALKKEYTLPGVSQTIIITRIEGKTKVPPKENISLLAKHNATMVFFLSINRVEKVVESLKEYYAKSTPAVIVYKASWPDQKIIEGTLENILDKAKRSNIKKTALFIVGNFLGDNFELSKLYDAKFSHGYRKSIY